MRIYEIEAARRALDVLAGIAEDREETTEDRSAAAAAILDYLAQTAFHDRVELAVDTEEDKAAPQERGLFDSEEAAVQS